MRNKLSYVLFFIAAVFLALYLGTQLAQGQTFVPDKGIKPLECGIQRVVPPESFRTSMLTSNGLEYYLYDTNGDSLVDVIMALHPLDENRYPLLYMFDGRDNKTFDGHPDW